jgi:WD40 repeat protein
LLLATFKDGFIFCFDFQKGEVCQMTRHLGSALSAMNIDSYGDFFAIACADGSVRIYDFLNLQRTKALVKMAARAGTTAQVGIYCVNYHPEDANVLLAAGWNDRVLFWDVRTGNVERSIVGPHIRGLGLVVHGNTVITGSARDKKQIETWDYGTAKKIADVILPDQGVPLSVTCVKIARNGLDFAASGTGANITKMFDLGKGKCFGDTGTLASGVSAVAVSPFGSSFVSGTL